MFVEKRRNKIEEIIIENKSIKVLDLVEKFDVSEETIRRDLKYLEKKGVVKKIYGGAMLAENPRSLNELTSVEKRHYVNHEEKVAIAKKAVDLITDNQIILLDAGTTTESIVDELNSINSKNNISLVTNGLNIAEKSANIDYLNVHVVGGELIPKTMGLVGPKSITQIKDYNIDIAFLGTNGITFNKGFSSSNLYEAKVKETMIAAAQKVVIVADHTKFNKDSFMKFCDFEKVDVLITSDLVDDLILNKIKEQDVEVIKAHFSD